MIAPHKERKNKAKRDQAGRGRKRLSPHGFLAKKREGCRRGAQERGARSLGSDPARHVEVVQQREVRLLQRPVHDGFGAWL